MTREQFITSYARNSRMSRDTLNALGFVAERCECGESGCKGWKMTAPQEKVPSGLCTPASS